MSHILQFANHDIFLAIAQLLPCLYIVLRGIRAINLMSRRTRNSIRCGYLLMTSGAAYGAVASFTHPEATTVLIAAGVALFLFGDMRHVKHA
jgi:hypothetical protein